MKNNDKNTNTLIIEGHSDTMQMFYFDIIEKDTIRDTEKIIASTETEKDAMAMLTYYNELEKDRPFLIFIVRMKTLN